MKAGWEIKSFAEIAEVKGGKRLPKGYSLQSIPTAHSYITVSDFTDDGTVDISRIRYISDEIFEEIKRYTISTKDLYLSIAGTIGKTGRIPPELDGANLTENACKLVFYPKINRDYVYYFTLSNDFIEQAGLHTRTAAQPKLALERLKTIKLAIPNSEAEQQRIVAILDEAFEAIAAARANAEQNRQNARALFESYLQSVFSQRGDGWRDSGNVLSSMCELIVDCEHKTAPTQDEGFPSIRTPNIGKGKLLLDNVKRVSEETYLAWTRRAVPLPGDLIFAREAPAGNVAVVPDGLQPCLGQRTVLIRPKKEAFDSLFLTYLLLSPSMQEHLLSHSKGSTVQHINMKDIRALRLGCIPPIREQRELAQRITDCSMYFERLESIYQRKVAALDELKQSLLQQAFSGQL
ncbi:restriction endonuclease subunit S [Aeromonas rivipollensis]|uniref:restriction endonuclease subunit S n=1 Tax=Aeromonas rivipollensis TaxID=948519 RepID=UPI00372D5EA2